MNTPAKVGAFVAALVVIFGAAAALGNAVGPVGSGETTTMSHEADDAMGDMTGASDELPGGLQVAENGYRLALAETRQQPGERAPITFWIIGPDGEPLTQYTTLHDKRLHLIVVRRDLDGFQHVHPTLSADGTWSTEVALDPGQWRVFADFDPSGPDPQVTLGADLAVAGSSTAKALPTPSRTARVDGYTVSLEGQPVAGADSELTLTVERDGRPVADLQPYLAAYGHLVALRDGDLAYLHVHPDGEPGDGRTEPGPGITFHTSFPSAGSYRLYLDFKHQGTVRTAEFTVDVPAGDGHDNTNGHGH
ncbi:hypothetical protein C6I20_15775 [Aeromicrobium sp. A1-2]|uniref:hypothetical protein n=1 Tax=Aeromicrobium sp. A1-2 TaxID=2107713 RepID=UPI000E4EB9FF|nr:hypothetical protein [Aeromicrobium sp. A1-2]AXT86486.1 hypothetical protein C6I20_15775 [Aeromicrobium sp. A1-2]